MKVLIVYAHSQATSFNGALLRTAVQTLEQERYQVRVSDLYAMGFNPVASEHDFKARRFEGHLQYGTLAYVGFEVLQPFVTWSVRYEDDAQRQQYLSGLSERLRRLDSIPLQAAHANDEFGKDWKLKPGVVPRTIGHGPVPTHPGATLAPRG